MSEDNIRIGFIGAGKNTRERHMPGFLKQEGVEFVSVANRSLESSRKTAEEFNIRKVAANWREVIEDPEVDAVCIGTWPYMHKTLTIAALEAGKHVQCEARMAMNSVEAHAMLDAWRRHPGLVAQIVPSPLTLAFDRTIIETIGRGDIGEIISLDARIAVGSHFPNPDSPLHWRQDRDLSGNNIMAMGIWYEAMMRWVGPAASVFAVGRSVVPHRRDESGRRVAMTIPDHIDIVGELEQGGQMRFAISTVIGQAPAVEVWIFGTEGTLCLRRTGTEDMKLLFGNRGGKGLEEVSIEPAKRGAWRVEEEFVNAIRGREEITHTDFVTGAKYMEWTDAVTASLRGRQTVRLPLAVGSLRL